MRRLLCALLLFSADAAAQSGESSFALGGYLKYLLSHTDVPSTGRTTDHLLHGRLNMKRYATDELTAALELRARAYAGGTVERTPDFLALIRNDHEFARLDATLWQSRSSVGYAEVDRLWADWNHGAWQATLGRQRVAMGTCLVWNPTDLFNPRAILDFDYEEQAAFDGGRAQYYLGPLSKVEAVVKPGKTATSTAAVIGWTTNVAAYDLHVLAGRRGMMGVVGASWAGQLSGGGFRGEVLVSQRPAGSVAAGYDLSRADGAMATAAVSGDYTFPNTLYVHAEALYTSVGATSNVSLFAPWTTRLGLLSPARWSTYGEVSGDLMPLLRGSVFIIQNPLDGSRVLVPSVTWSVATNLDLTAIALLFHGGSLTEFGAFGGSGFVRMRFSF